MSTICFCFLDQLIDVNSETCITYRDNEIQPGGEAITFVYDNQPLHDGAFYNSQCKIVVWFFLYIFINLSLYNTHF